MGRPARVGRGVRQFVLVIIALAERQALKRIDVVVDGQAELLEVVDALHATAPPPAPIARPATAARSEPR